MHRRELTPFILISKLRVAKGQDTPIAAPQYPVSKSTPPASEQNHTSPLTSQQLTTPTPNNSEREQTGGEFPSIDEDG